MTLMDEQLQAMNDLMEGAEAGDHFVFHCTLGFWDSLENYILTWKYSFRTWLANSELRHDRYRGGWNG